MSVGPLKCLSLHLYLAEKSEADKACTSKGQRSYTPEQHQGSCCYLPRYRVNLHYSGSKILQTPASLSQGNPLK